MSYQFEQLLLPGDSPSMVPDLAISPNGRLFCMACLTANQIKVYDLETRECLRIYENPRAQLDHPHAIAMTDRFVLVGNKMDPEDRPALLQVFDLDAADDGPICSLSTPLPYLREAHSFSLSGNRLLVTYAGTGRRALVCYAFDPGNGKIGEILDSTEDWFTGFGTPKGVCFNAAGTGALVTFISVKRIPSTLRQKLGRGIWLLRQRQGLRRLAGKFAAKFGELLRSGQMSTGEHATRHNGVALFSVSPEGSLSREPLQLHIESGYTRLENVDLCRGQCVLADPLRGEILVTRLTARGLPSDPESVISEHLSFPHCGRLAPDGKTLLVANYGLRVDRDKPQWHQFTEQRTDGVAVFRAQEAD